MNQQKQLNTFNIFTLTFGGVIGAGIFVMMGLALSFTGYSLPLATVAAVIYVNLTTLFSLIIVSFLPMKGGLYGQYSLVLPPSFLGVMSVSTVISGFIYSGFGTGIVDYLGAVFPAILPYKKPLAILIIAFAYFLTTREVKVLGKVQNVMTIVLIVALALFIGVGIRKVNPNVFSLSNDGFFLNGGAGFISATAMMGYACNGACASTSYASETKNARHSVPKGIFLAILAVMAVYVLMAVVAVGVLPIEEVANQSLSVVAQAIFSRPLYVVFIIGGAVFALLTSLIGGIGAFPFMLGAVAEDGWLPECLSKRTPTGYPTRLMILNFLFSVIPIAFDISFDNVVSMISLPSTPVMIVATIACFKFPKKYPELWKNSFFHMPYPVYCALLTLCTVAGVYYTVSYLITLSPQYYAITAILVVAMYAHSYIRIKSGAVDKEKLIEKRDVVIAEVMREEAEQAKI